MSASILRAEQVIWLTLLELMGGESVGTLTNTRPLISGVSRISKKLEFESSPCLDLASSFGSVDPLIRNIAQRFGSVGAAEVPMEVRHWKNPKFKVCMSSIALYMLSVFETARGGWWFSRNLRIAFLIISGSRP